MIVEHNIPRPARAGNSKYPWGELGVEASFFVPNTSAERMSSLAVRYAARRGGRVKFTCATVVENGVRGVRVWRTA